MVAINGNPTTNSHKKPARKGGNTYNINVLNPFEHRGDALA